MMKPFSARNLLMVSLVAMLSACGTLESVNPFAERERPLPGDRLPVFEGPQATAGNVSIASASSMTDWSQPGGNIANNPGHVAVSSGTSVAWRVSIGEGSDKSRRLSAAPVVAGGIVYTLDASGNLSASSASNGGRIWRSSILPEGESGKGVVGGGIAVSGNGVFVTSPYSEVIAFDASNGQRLWTKKMEIAMRGAPTVADGKVYAVDRNNTVYAFNVSDGEIAWSFNTIPETSGLVGSSSPAVGGGLVIAPLSTGDVVAFNAKGEPAWSDSLSRTGRFAGFAQLSDVSARPVIADGTVYAVGVSGRMIAASLRDGRRLWDQEIASAYMPAVSGNSVFAVTVDGRVVAVDRQNGVLRWAQQLPVGEKKKRITYAGPLLAGGRLYVGSSEGQLLTFDPANGSQLGAITIGEPVFIAPIAVNGRIYVLGDKGSLIAIQ